MIKKNHVKALIIEQGKTIINFCAENNINYNTMCCLLANKGRNASLNTAISIAKALNVELEEIIEKEESEKCQNL